MVYAQQRDLPQDDEPADIQKGMGRNIFGNAALMACYNHGDDYADQCVAYLNETKNQAVAYINEKHPQDQGN